jgi:hypothetical protein
VLGRVRTCGGGFEVVGMALSAREAVASHYRRGKRKGQEWWWRAAGIKRRLPAVAVRAFEKNNAIAVKVLETGP